jgi:hypothetical protein
MSGCQEHPCDNAEPTTWEPYVTVVVDAVEGNWRHVPTLPLGPNAVTS